ncbi:6603_t:CDS:2 [Cetraspora pellucida]|uniref:6603_t:CDS:1 n=1 Tax=Cetraspora pellucida TaxID=1433469 RepID=A0ACA9MSX3_9GLOM|nr:6603_t:CDS:2 [Cetraspora pellucida]
MASNEDSDWICFNPPLWLQRRILINLVLQESKVTSVVDFGCGEGSLLSFLVQPWEKSPITHLAGVDISQETLKNTVDNCRPRKEDFDNLRLTPLTIDIYQGSIDVADERLLGFEALVCSEVIEHVYPPVLNKFFKVVLGTYKPKVVIVTTPNAEFNVYFPQLKYGTPEALFRIDDHKFEWTRSEFQKWGNAGAAKYNYSVEYTGVGTLKDSDPTVGFATQIAIFRDLRSDDNPLLSDFGSYDHIDQIVFPIYDEPDKSTSEILEVIHYYMKFLCNPVVSELEQQQKKNCVKIDYLWDIHRIRQLCKTRDNLLEILDYSTDFTLLNADEVLAHVEYKLDSPKKENDEYDWHTNDASEMESDWNADDTNDNGRHYDHGNDDLANDNGWYYDYTNDDLENGKWSYEDTFSGNSQHLQSNWDN